MQLAWKHQFQFAGYYAALHKGFYRQAGLDVVLVEGGQGRFAREEVLSGRAQYGIAGSELLLHRRDGDPFVVIAPIFQHSPSILLVKKASGITNLQDLAGKRVMLLPGKKDADILAAFLNEGISLDAIHRLDQTYNLNDLIEGRTDAVSAYITNEPWHLLQKSIEPLIISPQTYGVDFYSDCLFTTEKEIKAHPGRVQAFLDASLRGWEYAMSHPEEIIDLILTEYGVKKEREHLKYEAEAIRKIMLPELVQIGHMNPGRWRHIARTYTKLGMLDADYPLDDFLYAPRSDAAYAWLKPLVFIASGISALLGGCILILLRFNKRLAAEVMERKRAQEALYQSESHLRTLVRTIPDLVWLKDSYGVYLFCNSRFERLFGASEKEIIGKTDYDFVDKEQAEFFRKHDQMAIDRGKPSKNEEEVVFADDGHREILETIKTPIYGEDGKLTGVLGIGRNITEYKKAVASTAKLNALLTSVIKQAPFAVHILEGNVNSINIVIENNESSRIMGEAIEGRRKVDADIPEMFKVRFFSIDGKYEIPLNLMPSPRAFQGEVVKNEEYLFRHADGTEIMVEASAAPIYDDKRMIIAVMVVFRDITERKLAEEEKSKLEKELRQAFKMEAIGRLAGGVAHDFNNMLSIILGHTEMLLEDAGAESPFRGSLKEILNASKRSSELVKQLLAFARKQPIIPKQLNLNTILEMMLKMLKRLIGENIDLVWRPAKKLGLVSIDPSQVDQLLINLCVNARDAVSGVGRIIIETANVTFDDASLRNHKGGQSGDYVMITVSDDGCGMDGETLDNLFEPFYSTKEVGHGSGLGLATVYGIVKQNRGFIRVYSELGEGTTFKIYLPRCMERPQQEKAVEVNPNPEALNGWETILLVEDEPSILKTATLILEKLGYTLLTAATPGEALRIVETEKKEIHLLLTDVIMPEMSGRELAEKLLKRNPGLKCLFMSGYTADVIANHGVLDEGLQFIQKPFTMRDIAVKLRQVLDG